jgi:hypothetical protein
MNIKYFFALFLCILLFSFAYSLEQDQIQNKLNETYLFSPIDNSETILSSNTLQYQNQKYWAIETNNHDFFVILDVNAKKFVNEDTLTNVLKTYFFFSKINEQNNKKIALFFNQIPDTITNFNYNLELIKAEVQHLEKPDQNVIIGIQNIETRAIAIGNESIDIRTNLISIDENLAKTNYDNYLNVKELNTKISNNSQSIIQKLNLLQQSILELKKTLIDANLPTDLKYTIGNSALTLPEQINQITEYLSYANQYNQEINDASKYSDESNYDSLKNNWELRKKRAHFLNLYLANDKTLIKTKQNNLKQLFEMIVANTNAWKNNKETNVFISSYNKMTSDLSKGEYESAERQLKPLKDSALKIFNDGKSTSYDVNANTNTTTDTNTTEESNPIFTIALGIIGAIVLIIVIINIIKKVKEIKEKNDKEEKEPEVDIKFN